MSIVQFWKNILHLFRIIETNRHPVAKLVNFIFQKYISFIGTHFGTKIPFWFLLAARKCRRCDYLFVSSSALCDFNSKVLCKRYVCHTKTSWHVIVWSMRSFIIVFVKPLRPTILIHMRLTKHVLSGGRIKTKNRNIYGRFVWICYSKLVNENTIFSYSTFSHFRTKSEFFLIVIKCVHY